MTLWMNKDCNTCKMRDTGRNLKLHTIARGGYERRQCTPWLAEVGNSRKEEMTELIG